MLDLEDGTKRPLDFLSLVYTSSRATNSAAKKVHKGGIGSALQTFLIFGSSFGPHRSKKVGIFVSRDKDS